VNSRDHKRIHSGLAPRDFHWIGELSMHPCELMDQELDYQIRKSIDRELEPARISKMPKSKLTRSDLRIMKLID
jgi:hypothetical protein